MGAIILVIKILGFVVLCIIAILLLVLFVPFRYEITAHIIEKIDFDINIMWKFGFTRIQISKFKDKLLFKIYLTKICVFAKIIGDNSKNRIDKKYKKKTKRRASNSILNGSCNFKDLKKILISMKEVFNLIKPKSINIRGVYGFYDPYVTGIVSAVDSIVANFNLFHNINLKPVFDDEIMDIKVEVMGEVSCIRVLIKVISVLIKTSIRKPAFLKSFK